MISANDGGTLQRQLVELPLSSNNAELAQWRLHRFCKAEHKHRGFESLTQHHNTNRKHRVKRLWYIWAKSLGEKASDDPSVADRVAVVRSVIVLSYLLTNLFIIAGVIRHW